jgi:hypothetical protein
METEELRLFRRVVIALSIPVGPAMIILLICAYNRDVHRGLHPPIFALIATAGLFNLVSYNSFRFCRRNYGWFG